MIAFVIIGLASSFHIYPIALYPFSQGVNDKQNIKHNIKRAIGQTIVTDQLKRQIRDKYAVDGDVLKNIMLSDRVDIFPWDIALLYAYNMNWQPRPVFQSYSAYTHGLDDKNASFYYSGDSPDAVIYSFESIDGRYPFFDEPRTYRALLTNYAAQPYASENMFVLRKSTNFSSNEAQLKFIEEKHVNIGDFVELPQGTDGLIFAEINWNMTFLGKAMNFFFKTMFHKNPTTFSFRLSNGEVRTHRFIRDLGKNSLFVSGYLRNSSDAFHFFSGDFERNVDGFTINGTAYLYSKGYNVRFYELSPESAKQQR
ncbi:hypothetical protein FACS1894167_07190 [Synergistales bacterium]|nr:hypothetical protein FACS1894167_07190 [Synergistales bacterium]